MAQPGSAGKGSRSCPKRWEAVEDFDFFWMPCQTSEMAGLTPVQAALFHPPHTNSGSLLILPEVLAGAPFHRGGSHLSGEPGSGRWDTTCLGNGAD